MHGFDAELGFVDARLTGHHFKQAQRVLATGEGNQNVVTVFDELVIGTRFAKAFYDLSFKQWLWFDF